MSAEKREWVLEPETEYRFELDPGTSLAIRLVKGNAEIFGAELVEGKAYLFGSECKAAVYTWKGCTLEVIGQPSTDYVSEETPVAAYGNLHIAFEQMRVRALRRIHGSPIPSSEPVASVDPPRVLVVGPENSGKTTVCKTLINFCVRAGQGWSPILVNVDPSEGGWAVPGAISAASVQSPIQTYSPANPLGQAATTAPTALSSNALLPLSYWYGHADTRRNPILLERVIRNLGLNVATRNDNDPEGSTAGTIVDTPSSFASGPAASNDQRQKLIKACVEAFKINIILVVGHEKLNVEMQRAYGSSLTVVKIPKSGGVVELDLSYRERVHNYQLHAYMYGQVIAPPPGFSSAPSKNLTFGGEVPPDVLLSPSSTTIGFDDLAVYRIGAESMAPSSALPIGAARVLSELQSMRIDPGAPGSGVMNSVLAMLAPFNADESERYDEEILDAPVAGYLIVTNVDVKARKLTVLSPNLGSLAGKTAVIGSFEWQDQ